MQKKQPLAISFVLVIYNINILPGLLKSSKKHLAVITKFVYQKKSEKDSGLSGKMAPSCKRPI